jgi:hypothetical protein
MNNDEFHLYDENMALAYPPGDVDSIKSSIHHWVNHPTMSPKKIYVKCWHPIYVQFRYLCPDGSYSDAPVDWLASWDDNAYVIADNAQREVQRIERDRRQAEYDLKHPPRLRRKKIA